MCFWFKACKIVQKAIKFLVENSTQSRVTDNASPSSLLADGGFLP